MRYVRLKKTAIVLLTLLSLFQCRFLLVRVNQNDNDTSNPVWTGSEISPRALKGSDFLKCVNCLQQACQAYIDRFPTICLDLAKGNIDTLWICAYGECAKFNSDYKRMMREDCGPICGQVDDESDEEQ